jgi:hypothetical protein
VPIDSATGSGENPEVDGNGTDWVVAWQHGSSNRDVFVRGVSVGGTPAALITSPIVQVTAGLPLYDEIDPSVIWTGGSALVGWDYRALPLFGDTAAVASLDPFHCAPCEGVVFPASVGGADSSPFGCSAASGAGPADDALLVFGSITPQSPTNADITAQFWRSADGVVTSLGGRCGTGGTALAPCARVPNASFTHRLKGASPNAGTLLLQALGQEADVCGPCTRIPALSTMVAMFFVTDVLGNASAPSTIPNNTALRGLTLFEQWLTLRAGGACPGWDVDMSNALRVVIE